MNLITAEIRKMAELLLMAEDLNTEGVDGLFDAFDFLKDLVKDPKNYDEKINLTEEGKNKIKEQSSFLKSIFRTKKPTDENIFSLVNNLIRAIFIATRSNKEIADIYSKMTQTHIWDHPSRDINVIKKNIDKSLTLINEFGKTPALARPAEV